VPAIEPAVHRDDSAHFEGANVHCQGIVSTRKFYMGLRSGEGQ
jgi:hypothetical protein